MSAIEVVAATARHLDAWASMRAALWSEDGLDEHRREILERLAAGGEAASFVALDAAGEAIGFAEASVRRDYVNGCETSPVAFVEGLFVARGHRRAGIALALVDAIAAWGWASGCGELASDAPLDNSESHCFHAAAGFEETERVVFFVRRL